MTTRITPHLIVRDAARALEFYARAFGARTELRLDEPGSDRVGHAEISIDGARIMLADEFPEYDTAGPATRGGTTVTLHLEVDDVDAITARARAAGATILREPTDEFYGARSARVQDPFGHVWQISTMIEEMSEEEMQRRYDELERQKSQG